MKTIDGGTGTAWTKEEKVMGTFIGGLLLFLLLAVFAPAFFAFAFPGSGLDIQSNAKVTKAEADLAKFRDAIDEFRFDCKRYPTKAEGFGALMKKPNGLSNWQGPYLQKEPSLDPWAQPYIYQFPGKTGPDSYLIKSLGPDSVQNRREIVDGSE